MQSLRMTLPKEKFTLLVIVIIVLSIYAAFTTKNYYWDGVQFALTIETANSLNPSLLHPNHLIYNIFGYSIYKLILGLGFNARALTVLQLANCVLSAMTAVLLFHILRISFRSAYAASILTFLFSFSATWWKFSTDANGYIPSMLFVVISLYLILPQREPRPPLVAITHAIAMCFHQLAVFFFPVVILGIYLQTSNLPLRSRRWLAAQYAGTAFLLTFGSYYLSFYLVTASLDLSGLFGWLTSYSPENGFIFNIKDSLVHTLSGEVKLFFGGRFSFLKEVLNPFTVFLIAIAFASLIGLLVQIINKRREKGVERVLNDVTEKKSLLLLCAFWAGVYFRHLSLIDLFCFFPYNLEFSASESIFAIAKET